MQSATPPLPPLEQPYLDLLRQVRTQGATKTDRTGTGTLSTFGAQLRFDLQRGFPLITTKKVFWKAIAYELLWFLRGDSNAKWLQERGVTIWDEWAKPDGDLGPVYGVQWRSWPTPDGGHIDQIAEVIQTLKKQRETESEIKDGDRTCRNNSFPALRTERQRTATGHKTTPNHYPVLPDHSGHSQRGWSSEVFSSAFGSTGSARAITIRSFVRRSISRMPFERIFCF